MRDARLSCALFDVKAATIEMADVDDPQEFTLTAQPR
jgi:hypothetical protein